MTHAPQLGLASDAVSAQPVQRGVEFGFAQARRGNTARGRLLICQRLQRRVVRRSLAQQRGQLPAGQVGGDDFDASKAAAVAHQMQQRLPQPAGGAAAEDQHRQRAGAAVEQQRRLSQGKQQPEGVVGQKHHDPPEGRRVGQRRRVMGLRR